MSGNQISRVFISYAWEDNEDEWVTKLAGKLRGDGIEAIIDVFYLQPGDILTKFMEDSISKSDFVLIICTPRYRKKSNQNSGVSYEGNIISGERFALGNERKYVPILRSGAWAEAAPPALLGKLYIDMRESANQQEAYRRLLLTLKKDEQFVPPIISQLEQFRGTKDRILDYETYEWNAAEIDTVWGFVDSNGVEVVPKKYPILREYSYERALFGYFRHVETYYKRDPIFGYLDLEGNEVIERIYDYAEDFNYGVAKVGKGNYYGYIDPFGNEIIPIKYEILGHYNSGLVCAGKTDSNGHTVYGYFDLQGEIALPFLYEKAEDFSNGIAQVSIGGRVGCIAPNGSEIIPIKYSDMTPFNDEGIAVVMEKGKVGMVNRYGKVIVSCYFDTIGVSWPGRFSEDVVGVSVRNLWGFLNCKGEVVIPLKYDGCTDFKGGIAGVMKDEKWGCIDKKGNVVVPIKYDWLRVLNKGFVRASLDGKTYEFYVNENKNS